ncbi:MAG: hypothetical protein PUD15_08755 [Prevotella sp.]|nr:hypothetical protein [Prevotella sp.]
MNRYKMNFMAALVLLGGLLMPAGARAQSHGDHVMVGLGASYPRGFEGTLSYEHETDYHSAWEYFGTYYIKYKKDETVGHITHDSFWNNYRTWNIGIAYKPCVTRGRNHHGSLRIGVSGGSDFDHAIGTATLGYEHTYNLYNGWSLFWQIKEDVVIRGEDRFKTGVTVGVKMPL